MQIDAMLVRFVQKINDALGGITTPFQSGRLAEPVDDWTGSDVIEFMRRVRNATGDDYMALGSGPCRLGALDLMIELTARCATLREAIDCGQRYLGFATDAVRVELEEQGDEAIIKIVQTPSVRDPQEAIADWTMISWHKLAQFLIGVEVPLHRADFHHALDAPYEAYSAMFSADCNFGVDACHLVFDRSFLDKRVVKTAGDASGLVHHKVGYFSKPVGLVSSSSEIVKNILRREMLEGRVPPTLEDLSEEFGVCSQTLRRQLRAENTTYREIKRQTREEIEAN